MNHFEISDVLLVYVPTALTEIQSFANFVEKTGLRKRGGRLALKVRLVLREVVARVRAHVPLVARQAERLASRVRVPGQNGFTWESQEK